MSCGLQTHFLIFATLALFSWRACAVREDSLQDSHVQLEVESEAAVDAAAAAVEFFQRIVFDYKGVHINEGTFTCESYTYKINRGLGHGFEGVTVLLDRVHADAPEAKPIETVVAKLTKSPAMKEVREGFRSSPRKELSDSAATLKKECAVYDKLKDVKHTLKCQATCMHGLENQEHMMVVLTPFVEHGKPFTGTWIGGPIIATDRRPFSTLEHSRQVTGLEEKPVDPRVEKGLRLTFETLWGMLRARIANRDQQHNILYEPDGTPTFIDMGMAVDIDDSHLVLKPEWYVTGFLAAIFRLIPPLMLDWAEEELIKTRPHLPADMERWVKDSWLDWKKNEGSEAAEKEKKALKQAKEDRCRFCISFLCDQERCADCDICLNTDSSVKLGSVSNTASSGGMVAKAPGKTKCRKECYFCVSIPVQNDVWCMKKLPESGDPNDVSFSEACDRDRSLSATKQYAQARCRPEE